jgi:hypothetical protein
MACIGSPGDFSRGTGLPGLSLLFWRIRAGATNTSGNHMLSRIFTRIALSLDIATRTFIILKFQGLPLRFEAQEFHLL